MIKGKPPRLDLIYVDQPLYFITFCTLHRRPLLANAQAHENFRSYCTHAIAHNVGVGRYVMMPEHVHFFVRGDEEFELGLWIRGLKREILHGPGLWQPGFFDHILRSDESYSEKWDYVRNNPMRAGLIPAAEKWPYQGEIVLIDRA
jgi:REP element-mobilizing transposase RayT